MEDGRLSEPEAEQDWDEAMSPGQQLCLPRPAQDQASQHCSQGETQERGDAHPWLKEAVTAGQEGRESDHSKFSYK